MEAKILVVDGDKQVREYLSNMLGSVGGFSVVVAETAEGALQKIRSETFDLVLVDLKLPDRDGLQLITEIVNFKPEALTVLITGHGSIDSAVEAMKRGPSDYLTKPFDLDDTLARLRRVLQEKKRFIPLTTMTMSSIRKEEIGYATSIFNLLRNLGGSFGMAFVTTMLARRGQLHQVHLGEHFTPFDRNFQLALPQISQTLQDKGFIPSLSDQGGFGVIYREVVRQASMLSFNDAFYFLSTMMMFVLPLVLLMKKGKEGVSRGGIH